MEPTIARVESTDATLRVWIDDNTEPLEVSWLWVQDHSEDGSAFDPATRQRTVNTFALRPELQPESVAIVGDTIQVVWTDNPSNSVLPARLLGALKSPIPRRRLWSSAAELDSETGSCTMTFDDIMNSDDALRQWLSSVALCGFAVASGVPLDVNGAEAIANRIGYVRRTIFGDMWTLSSEVIAHADSAYGMSFLEPHTDGSYSHDGPGMQLFSCSERTGTGGESILVDGFAAAEKLKAGNPEAFRILSEVVVPAHYIEDDIELRAARPTIEMSPEGWIQQVTFNNYDRSPFVLAPAKMDQWYSAYREFHRLLNHEPSWWTHRLEPGEALLFDNWRCLHGRLAYTGRRVFHGCYLNHEDLESRIRVLS